MALFRAFRDPAPRQGTPAPVDNPLANDNDLDATLYGPWNDDQPTTSSEQHDTAA